MDEYREQRFRRKTMKFRARMIATTAAVALLVPPFLFAADDSMNSSAKATAVDSAATPDAMGNVEVPAMLMAARSAASAPPSGSAYRSYPRAELFLGYSYLRSVPMPSSGNRLVRLNGGSTSIAFNLNRYFGLVGDFGGFDDTKIQITGTGANPPSAVNASGTAYTYMAGPRLSYRHRVTPFAQALFGGVHASQVTLSNCTGSLCTPLQAENAFAMTAGGGIDLRIQRHVAIRLVQAEYLMTRFGSPTTGIRESQNDIRLSSGLVFGFGGNSPPLAVDYSCSVSPSLAFPGDPITVTGVAMNLNPNPKRVVTYTWTSDGGMISGTSSTATVDTGSAAPGTYTVKGHVSQGMKPGQMADCSAQFTVRSYDPPTISCSANPSSVNPGDSSTITTSASSPQNRPLTYSYNATAGSISGSTPSAMLSTAGAAPGTITVTCGVADDKGHNLSATTSVNVIAPPPPAPPPPPPAPMASSLCSVSFERDATRPTRVDNEAKACLDDIALNLQRSTDAKLALVGNEDAKEQAAEARQAKLKPHASKPSDSVERAVNTKQYLVNEKGIDASRILLYTGTDDAKTVTTTLIPTGAVNPAASNIPVD
jgi:opacity protein-like surface antigen